MRLDLAAVRRLCLALPAVEEGTAWGQPCFRVAKKMICVQRPDGALVVMVGYEERNALVVSEPTIFFTTDHYRNSPAVCVLLDQIDEEQLANWLAYTWRRVAPKKLQKTANV